MNQPACEIGTRTGQKLLSGLRAVNVTLGLPLVRTSVAHGTAYDIAGRGIADHHSLIEAARVAARLLVSS